MSSVLLEDYEIGTLLGIWPEITSSGWRHGMLGYSINMQAQPINQNPHDALRHHIFKRPHRQEDRIWSWSCQSFRSLIFRPHGMSSVFNVVLQDR